MNRQGRYWLPLLLLLPLGACNQDPMTRPGTVSPRGLNDANLRAMVVDPAHLRQGVAATSSPAATAVRPIERLRRGERPSLSGGNGASSRGGGGLGGAGGAMGGQDGLN